MPPSLRRTSDAAAEILTVAEAKSHLRVVHDADDTYIEEKIKQARQVAENRLAVSFITQTWTLTLDEWPEDGVIELRNGPVQSVTTLKYYNTSGVQTTLTSGTDYQVDVLSRPGRIAVEPETTWPSLETGRLHAIEAIYVAGYGDDADDLDSAVKQGIELILADLYLNREDSAPTKLYQVPHAAWSVLTPYGEISA